MDWCIDAIEVCRYDVMGMREHPLAVVMMGGHLERKIGFKQVVVTSAKIWIYSRMCPKLFLPFCWGGSSRFVIGNN